MGPRFFNRGNARRPQLHGVDDRASMGPRFFNRGNFTHPGLSGDGMGASMGPRFFNRGNEYRQRYLQYGTTGFNGAAVFQPRKHCLWVECNHRGSRLQWGRGFSTAETSDGFPGLPKQALLQWGRGFSTAETRNTRTGESGPGWLQWGRGFSTAETFPAWARVATTPGFNGAAVFQPRKRS